MGNAGNCGTVRLDEDIACGFHGEVVKWHPRCVKDKSSSEWELRVEKKQPDRRQLDRRHPEILLETRVDTAEYHAVHG